MEVLPVLGLQRAEFRQGVVWKEGRIGMALVQPVFLDPRNQRPVGPVEPDLRRLAGRRACTNKGLAVWRHRDRPCLAGFGNARGREIGIA